MATIQFIIILLTLIVGFASLFLNSYFTEKGKNRAVKEDIKKITELVEGVKTDLLFNNTVKSTIYSDRRMAVINAYEAFCSWFYKLDYMFTLSVNFTEDQILPRIKENDEAYYQLIIAESKMELFIDDITLATAAFNLKSRVHDLLTIIEPYFVELKGKTRELDNSLPEAIIHDPKEKEEILKRAERLNEEKIQLYKNTRELTKPIRNEILNLIKPFRDICFKVIANEYTLEQTNN